MTVTTGRPETFRVHLVRRATLDEDEHYVYATHP